MKNLLLFATILVSGLFYAQTSINDFIGDWKFQDGLTLKITPLSNDEGGTKARYDHGTQFKNPDHPTPDQQNLVIIYNATNKTLTFKYLQVLIEYLNLYQYANIVYNVTTYNSSQMVLTAQSDGTVRSYQKTSLAVSDLNNTSKKVSIAQNPVRNDLILNLPQDISQVKVKIVNAEGRQVKDAVYNQGQKLDVSNLTSGVYFILIDDNNVKSNLKMIKK